MRCCRRNSIRSDRASDLEFAAVAVPQIKNDPVAELKNPSREELLLHIARNARKRKDFDESAKFYRRIVELQKDRTELQFEFAEMLAEAGKNIELKEVVEKIERRSKPKDDAGRKKLAALKEQVGKKSTPLPTAPVPPSSNKMHAADNDGWSKSGQESIPKEITETPKPATVESPPKTFDSLDPPMIPTPPTVGDASKKNSGPPDDLKPPEPDHHPSNDDYRQLLAGDPKDATPLESQPIDAEVGVRRWKNGQPVPCDARWRLLSPARPRWAHRHRSLSPSGLALDEHRRRRRAHRRRRGLASQHPSRRS